MSEGLNKVILLGNLGQDPELKFTQGGQGVLSLRIATSESYWDKKSNDRKETTEWHTITVWGKRGEALSKILNKGDRIAVEGRLQTRSWEAKDGSGKRYGTSVIATNVILAGGGGKRESGGGDEAPYTPPPEGGGFGDDDIPF